ncbi:peptide-methionine (S)-S-oxide reductase MsrA [Bdellovibrio sp. HCB185ZH]|uniref:peptide-methionine (S)-S-oxide reductase MsrA n=1 Tax=Bdellovibrio sp. HCB185ZH TaxID=3394235 RepID=UPI0039A5E048
MKTTKLTLTLWTFITCLSFGVFAKPAGKAKAQTATPTEVSYLAGGCFWGMEELLRKLPGVTRIEVGYMGGKIPNATYNIVHTGTSNHAETVKVEFNPQQLSYENLLLYFFKIHDPTTLNRQGNDIGTQYRSAIFYTSDVQKETAHRVIARVDKSKAWGKPVTTVVEKAGEFWNAEEEHQDYLQKNPEGYTCHFVRKVEF